VKIIHMGDKGHWSIRNPAGEEVSFESREELRQAVLEDDIEPHAESIPPEPSRISHPVDDGEAELFVGTLEPSITKKTSAPKIALPSEGEIADDVDAPPVSLSDMDEPTLQFTKPLSAPPTATRASPAEDEGSPLSLSEVGGSEDAPEALSGVSEAPTKPFMADEEDEEDEEDEADEKAVDEDTAPQVDAKTVATVLSGAASGPASPKASLLDEVETETPKRPSRMTTPPPLPVSALNATTSEGRASRPSIPRLSTDNARASKPSVLPPLQPPAKPGPSVLPPRLSPPPKPPGAMRPTAPSLPPPDIVPDFSTPGEVRESPPPPAPATSSPEPNVAEARKPLPAAPVRETSKKPSWLIPVLLVGIGIAFWLGSRNRAPATENPEVGGLPRPTFNADAPKETASAALPQPPATPATGAAAPAAPAASEGENASTAAAQETQAVPAEPEPVAPSSAAPAPVASAASSAPKVSAAPSAPPSNKPRTTPPAANNAAPVINGEGVGPLLRRAAAVQRTGDYGAAREIYLSLLQKEPKNAEVLSGLGDTSRALGDKSSAKSYYVRALDASSSFMPALLGLADTEWDLGERVSAQKHYADLVEHNPNAPDRVQRRARGIIGP